MTDEYAFPSGLVARAEYKEGRVDREPLHVGMTLRDWFAGQALVGLMNEPWARKRTYYDRVALEAYEIADAMLKERGHDE